VLCTKENAIRWGKAAIGMSVRTLRERTAGALKMMQERGKNDGPMQQGSVHRRRGERGTTARGAWAKTARVTSRTRSNVSWEGAKTEGMYGSSAVLKQGEVLEVDCLI
jgi:hypothetical protein